MNNNNIDMKNAIKQSKDIIESHILRDFDWSAVEAKYISIKLNEAIDEMESKWSENLTKHPESRIISTLNSVSFVVDIEDDEWIKIVRVGDFYAYSVQRDNPPETLDLHKEASEYELYCAVLVSLIESLKLAPMSPEFKGVFDYMCLQVTKGIW